MPNPNAKRNVLGTPVMVTLARFFDQSLKKLVLSIWTLFLQGCTIYLVRGSKFNTYLFIVCGMVYRDGGLQNKHPQFHPTKEVYDIANTNLISQKISCVQQTG